jgi:hypothetical protein
MRFFLCLMMLFPGLALAQVNVEKLRSNGTESGLAGSLGVTAAYTQGNILFADFGTSAHLEWKQGKDTVFWIVNHRFAAKRTQSDLIAEPSVGLWDEEAHFSNNRLMHLRYNRSLGPGWWWELFTQYEYNEFLLLDRRLLAGTGPRFTLKDGKTLGAWFGIAAMLEEENLNPEKIAATEEASRVNLRASSYLSATWRIGKGASWTTTGYWQPRLEAFEDHRLAIETGLVFPFSKAFSFTVDARFRRDSEPPQTPDGTAAVLPSDLTVKNGIKVKF